MTDHQVLKTYIHINILCNGKYGLIVHAETTLVLGAHTEFSWASWVFSYLGFGHLCTVLPVGAHMGLAHKPHYLKYIAVTSKQTHL